MYIFCIQNCAKFARMLRDGEGMHVLTTSKPMVKDPFYIFYLNVTFIDKLYILLTCFDKQMGLLCSFHNSYVSFYKLLLGCVILHEGLWIWCVMWNNAICLSCLRSRMLSEKSSPIGVTIAAAVWALHLLFILFIFSIFLQNY